MSGEVSEFYIACWTGDLTSVERLLHHLSFYDLNRLEPNGSTALHAAAFSGHIEIVQRLVDHGGILRTLKNKYNLTPAEETTHENVRRLLQSDATYQPRKRFINDEYYEKSSEEQTIRNPSNLLFSRALLAYANAKRGVANINDERRREWVVTYDNNCVVLEHVSREHMRKWLTKFPLSSLLEAINKDYVNNPGVELAEKDRETIQEYIRGAIQDDDPRYLVRAYTLDTGFYKQLNKELADKGLDFRRTSDDLEKYRDDRPPTGVSECLFAAVLIHHPFFIPYYYAGVTYRGMGITEADLYDYRPGTRIFSRSFLSTSKSLHPVTDHLPFNTPNIVPVICIYRTSASLPATGLAISGLSQFPVEEEVLLFPYVAFRIVKVDFAHFSVPDHGKATVIFLDQVTDESKPWPLCGYEGKQQEQVEKRQPEHVREAGFSSVKPTWTSLKAPREIPYSLSQPIQVLYEAYKQGIDHYMQMCLSLHSNLLCVDELGVDIVENCPFKDWPLNPFDVFTPNELEWLCDSTNINSLSIPLEPATRVLLPFSPKNMDHSSNSIDIEEVISREQCCIIFGQPGMGKTTLARWITFLNAQRFTEVLKNGSSTETNAVRLPILVHLGQLVQILELHADWTLLDCLCCDQKAFVRDYICQQHAVIILDGLDEIINTHKKYPIIKLLHQFILTYIPNGKKKSSGNQLIITSCQYAGFEKSCLAELPCYTLKPLSADDATSFIERWFRQIASTGSSSTHNWHDKAKELIRMLSAEMELQELMSNTSLLAGICILMTIRTLVNSVSLSLKRVVFCHFTCALLLRRVWRKFCYSSVATEEEFDFFLIHIAAFIHQHSSDGLIESFHMGSVCHSWLHRTPKQTSCEYRHIVDDFECKTDANTIGVLVPCGSDHYGFLFPAFQHYLTGLSMIQTSTADNNDEKLNIESTVNRISYHITDPRYRQALLLTLSYISWQCTPTETERFYEELLRIDSIRFQRQLPLAAMLVMTVLSELQSLPPIKLIYKAFDQFTKASAMQGWFTRFPFFAKLLVKSLDSLSPADNAQDNAVVSTLNWEMLLNNRIQTEEIPSPNLAAIIALYGGLHRTSPLANLLVDCLNEKRCDFVGLLDERKWEDTSSETVDLFVLWLCMDGVGQLWVYEKYMIWPAFWRAVAKLKRVALDLNEYYSANEQHTLSSSLYHQANQIIEQYVYSLSACDRSRRKKADLLSFVQAMTSAMCRLMFRGENTSQLGMVNLPISDELRGLLMSEEYSLRTHSRRLIDFVQLVSPPFLPKHLHVNMNDFPLAVIPRAFQPLFACLFSSSSTVQLPFVCVLGEVIRTLSRGRADGARHYHLLALLRAHFEEHQLTNCFTGLIYTMALSELRSFFVPLDRQLSEQDHRMPFNLLLDEEQQDDFLLDAVQEVQHQHNEDAADDLALYRSAISLATLVAAIDQRRKTQRQSIVHDAEAMKTALLIDDSILRLHAITVVWQFEQIHSKCVPEVALTCVSSQTPLPHHVLLFLMFWSTFASTVALDNSKPQLDRLLDRLESRTDPLAAEIEQAVCETLVLALDHHEFPFLRSRIYQFVKGCEWSKEPSVVSTVLGFRSSSLIDCMHQTSSSSTFLASMYLMQLSIDASTLCTWFKRETPDDFNDIQTQILRLFDHSNQSDTLTLEATINVGLLEQRLARCHRVQSSALPVIAAWCDYKTHPYFRKFAYYAALLTLQQYPTRAAMEICCDLLQNNDDDLRQRAYETLGTIDLSSTRMDLQELDDFFSRLALPFRHNNSAFVYETVSHASLLQSVKERCLHSDVRKDFFLHAYTECRKMLVMLDEVQKSDEQELCLVELVRYASHLWCITAPEKMSTEESLFIDDIIELLSKEHIQRLPILSKMLVNRSNPPYIPRGISIAAQQRIKSMLTKVVEGINDQEFSLSEDAVATMIKYYFHDDTRCSVDLELLAKLLSNKSFSATITDAAACCFVRYHCFLSSSNPDLCDLLQIFSGSHLRLYHTLMILTDDSVTSVAIRFIALELIKEYTDDLLPLFIEELCGIVTMFDVELSIPQSCNNTNHFKIALSVIDTISATRFRELVEKRMDESVFKRGLYCTSKQLDSNRRLACLQIVTSLYGELTVEVNNMFYCAMWEKASDRQLACACIPNIRQIADRSVAEELFVQLEKNESRQRRYLAGMLLVQLARCDELSISEVQRKLTEAINSPLTTLDNNNIDLMQDNGSRTPNVPLDQALLNLLLQLSFLSDRIPNQTHPNDDYRVPDNTNIDEEFSRLVDVECSASCIVRPSSSI